ncbi:hypothetical protein JOC85_000736 [Bacillus mesophilus]|nr:hypothetical protein [Bacillus mesophilus]MBM7659969.1 hypothetical protein [Bacillus mesophilus]
MEAIDWKLISFLVMTFIQEHQLRFSRHAQYFWSVQKGRGRVK